MELHEGIVGRFGRTDVMSVREKAGVIYTHVRFTAPDGTITETTTATSRGISWEDYQEELRRLSEQTRDAMPPWTFMAPRAFREAFFREWLEERDYLRAHGVSEVFIWFTLATQLATCTFIGGKDRILDLVGRVCGTPKGPVK